MTNSFSKALLRHDIFVTQQDFFFLTFFASLYTHTPQQTDQRQKRYN